MPRLIVRPLRLGESTVHSHVRRTKSGVALVKQHTAHHADAKARPAPASTRGWPAPAVDAVQDAGRTYAHEMSGKWPDPDAILARLSDDVESALVKLERTGKLDDAPDAWFDAWEDGELDIKAAIREHGELRKGRRLYIDMRLAEQLGLFAPRAEHQVKTHVQRTKTGVATVQQHTAHHTAARPKAPKPDHPGADKLLTPKELRQLERFRHQDSVEIAERDTSNPEKTLNALMWGNLVRAYNGSDLQHIRYELNDLGRYHRDHSLPPERTPEVTAEDMEPYLTTGKWLHGPWWTASGGERPDRAKDGTQFSYLVRGPDDGVRVSRASRKGQETAWRGDAKASVQSWTDKIREVLSDGKPRTFNRIVLEATGGQYTADVMGGTNASSALWNLVEAWDVAHTPGTPTKFALLGVPAPPPKTVYQRAEDPVTKGETVGTVSISPALADEWEALEVETLAEDSSPGKVDLARALNSAKRSKRAVRLNLTEAAVDYLLHPNGAIGNTEDMIGGGMLDHDPAHARRIGKQLAALQPKVAALRKAQPRLVVSLLRLAEQLGLFGAPQAPTPAKPKRKPKPAPKQEAPPTPQAPPATPAPEAPAPAASSPKPKKAPAGAERWKGLSDKALQQRAGMYARMSSDAGRRAIGEIRAELKERGLEDPTSAPADEHVEGAGEQHQVKTHLRRTKTGVATVTMHERTGKGHKVRSKKTRAKKREEEPQQPPQQAAEPEPEPEPPAPEPEPPTAAVDPSMDDRSGRTEHHDVGAVIEGARKHKYSQIGLDDLGDIEAEGDLHANKQVTKSKVLGDHDADYDRELGSTPGASYLKRELFKAVATRPYNSSTARATYVEGCIWLRKELDQAHTVDEVVDFLDGWRLMAQGLYAEHVGDADALLERVGVTKGDTSAAGKGGGYHSIQHEDGTRTLVSFYALRQAGILDLIRRYEGPAGSRRVVYAAKRKMEGEDTDNVWARYLSILGPEKMHAIVFRQTSKRKRPMFWKKHVSKAHGLERDDDWEGLTTSKRTSKRAKKWQRNSRGIIREGGPTLRGPFTGERLAKTFGLRGVQYGNWVKDEDAAKHLEAAHGAFVDLADVLGIDPKMIAQGGMLGMAFGARGKGRFGAHYEPGQLVINLTQTRGSGTLAHEWGHFLDHITTGTVRGVGDVDTIAADDEIGGRVRAKFLSHGEGHSNVHPEVAEAVNEAMTAMMYQGGSGGYDPAKHDPDLLRKRYRELQDMRSSISSKRRFAKTPTLRAEVNAKIDEFNAAVKAYQQDSRDAARIKNGGGVRTAFARHASQLGDYWARPHEMFARAFESYVQDKLEDNGRVNTYLVDGTRKTYKMRRAKSEEDLEPYPQGEERKAIHAALDKVFAAMRKHGTLRKAMQAAGLLPKASRLVVRL